MSEKNEEKNLPENIKRKILELKKLETLLGHLPSENWTVSELQKRTEDSSHQQSLVQMEAQTENLFAEICDELVDHKFNYAEIAQAINLVLSQSGGIKYCNEMEVREALGIE